MTRGLLAAFVLCCLPTSAHGWGANGHRTVTEIAQRHLNHQAIEEVERILRGRSLASVSNWADEIRSEERWDCAAPFHYATIPPGARYLDEGVPPQGDALGAIVYYEETLSNRSAPLEQRVIALKFLVHFIADVHQPLHVGLGCDRGGNDVQVQWFGEGVNLHSVWDRLLHESLQLSYSELSDFLDHVSPEQIDKIQKTTPLDWFEESQEILKEVYRCSTDRDRCPCVCGDCKDGYSVFGGCTTGPCRLQLSAPIRLAWEYRHRSLPIMESRFLEAGLRVAAMLNWALSDTPMPPAYLEMKRRLQADPSWDDPPGRCPLEDMS